MVTVADPNDVEVTLSVSSSPCNTHLTFTFYVYEPPPDPCSYWVWCCTTFENNPCCSGEWRLRSGPGGDEPCSSGCCHGQVRVICAGCDNSSSGSTSSSSRGSGQDCAGCEYGDAPEAVTVTFNGTFEEIEAPDQPYGGECAQATCQAFFGGHSFTLPQVDTGGDELQACAYCEVFDGACSTWMLRVTLTAGGVQLVIVSGALGPEGDCTDFAADGKETIYFAQNVPIGEQPFDCRRTLNEVPMVLVSNPAFHSETLCEWGGATADRFVTANIGPA